MTDAAPRSCWSCKGPVAATAIFCDTCGAIQPPGQSDAFARFGLTPGFDVDVSALEREFFDLQRRLHPDKFTAIGGTALALSQQQAAALNDAFEVLKDPVARAGQLIALAGRDVPGKDSHTVNDPALLMEAMEMREALAEADSVDQIKPLILQTREQAARCEKDLSAAFAAQDLGRAASLMVRLRYLLKMNDEIRSRRAKLARRA